MALNTKPVVNTSTPDHRKDQSRVQNENAGRFCPCNSNVKLLTFTHKEKKGKKMALKCTFLCWMMHILHTSSAAQSVTLKTCFIHNRPLCHAQSMDKEAEKHGLGAASPCTAWSKSHVFSDLPVLYFKLILLNISSFFPTSAWLESSLVFCKCAGRWIPVHRDSSKGNLSGP